MPQKTIAYVTYDEENMYFAFKCYDNEPDKIVGTITSRDGIRMEDWICINLDSQNDHQALYGIYVNPHGIQEDSRFAAGKEDLSTDLVWYSAAKIDDEGYVVEVRLPLKSIRFSDSDKVTMGVILERRISRNTTHGTFPGLESRTGFGFSEPDDGNKNDGG